MLRPSSYSDIIIRKLYKSCGRLVEGRRYGVIFLCFEIQVFDVFAKLFQNVKKLLISERLWGPIPFVVRYQGLFPKIWEARNAIKRHLFPNYLSIFAFCSFFDFLFKLFQLFIFIFEFSFQFCDGLGLLVQQFGQFHILVLSRGWDWVSSIFVLVFRLSEILNLPF